MEKTGKVIIRSLKEASSWSGSHRFKNCTDTVIASLGRDGYNTGLTDAEAKDIEERMRMKEGTLGRYSDFWKEYAVKIHDKPLTLDLSIANDRLDYALLKNSKKVAGSIADYNMGKCPKAIYVIHDASEEIKRENKKIVAEKKAYAAFLKMSQTDMKQILKLMGRRAETMSSEAIENATSNAMKEDPANFVKIVEIDNFKHRILIEDLLHVNILRRSGGKYIYGDDVLAHNKDQMIEYLNDPINQEMLITFKEGLKAREKSS